MKRLAATGILVLVLLASWSATLPTASAQNDLAFPLDRPINEFTARPNVVYSTTVDLVQNSTFFMVVDCSTCTVNLSRDNSSFSFTESLVKTDLVTGQYHLSMTVEQTENVRYTLSNSTTQEHPTVRPAPGQAMAHHAAGLCPTPMACMDLERSGVLGTVPEGNEVHFAATGHLVGSDEFYIVEVEEGDTVEWQWLATTAGVRLQAYAQTNSTEILLDGESVLTSSYLQPTSDEAVAWWTAAEDGRLVFRLSTQDTHVTWKAIVFHHQNQPVTDLTHRDLTQAANIQGHGTTTGLFDWPVNTKLTLEHPYGEVEVRVDQLMNGSWILGTTVLLNGSSPLTTYPYPGVTGGRVMVESNVAFAVHLRAESYADLNHLEAPSYLPGGLDTNNASWPILNLSNVTVSELTLAVHDTSDTFRIVVDGWEDSIHYVQFTLDGNVTGMEAQMWDIDQTTGEVLATDITRPVSEQLRIGLQVGRGTHYIQFRLQDSNASTSNLWGEDVASKLYFITPAYSLMDEGEEPWFEPSDEAVWWGSFARWFLGFLFLIPAVYVGVSFQRDRQFAKELLRKASRLAWYSERLSSGETTVKASRKDLNRALMAVAQLPWEEGINAWGEPALTHTTDGMAMGVWRVDKRLARTKGTWPLVIGVHVLKGTWELAALRFDAPHGQPFEVVHVEPRFLHQGEEVFLDTLNEGHRAFLYVELQGQAPAVDIELNGRMDRVPFASRIPQTVLMEEE